MRLIHRRTSRIHFLEHVGLCVCRKTRLHYSLRTPVTLSLTVDFRLNMTELPFAETLHAIFCEACQGYNILALATFSNYLPRER